MTPNKSSILNLYSLPQMEILMKLHSKNRDLVGSRAMRRWNVTWLKSSRKC